MRLKGRLWPGSAGHLGAMTVATRPKAETHSTTSSNWIRLRPASLTRYIALSARFSISGLLAASPEDKTTPMLPVQWCSTFDAES